MARPKRTARRIGHDSRTVLLRAAALEFAERGYDAARVDRIAARARLNKAMLYYHFGSKQALYLDVLRETFGAVVEEAGARPWFPPIMLREIASGAPHLDPTTFAMMNAVFGAVRDVIVQGQREGTFRDVDPLLTHMTIMPPVLIFFARQRVVASAKVQKDLSAARTVDVFVRHMQASARGMLRKD
jgi:TetR/AcrR family transcriptional regulator